MTLPVEFVVGAAALAGAAGGCVHHATYGVRTQWLGPSEWRGRTDTSSVALTFDDGPGPDTEAILDILGTRGVRAAFFVVGRQVQRHPAIARRIVAEGHDIGNHSFSHPIFLYRTPRATREEMTRTQAIIEDTTGVRPVFARPPCGVRTPAWFSATRALGLRTVQWTVAGFDWKRRSADLIAGAILRGTDAGAILLLHDADAAGRRDRRATAESIPLIVDGAESRGLRVAPLHALLQRNDTWSAHA